MQRSAGQLTSMGQRGTVRPENKDWVWASLKLSKQVCQKSQSTGWGEEVSAAHREHHIYSLQSKRKAVTSPADGYPEAQSAGLTSALIL